MKPQDFNQLIADLLGAIYNEKTSPVKTNPDYSWQDFDVFTDESDREALEPGLRVTACVYESGNVGLTLNYTPKADSDTSKAVLAAYKRLRAKNLCLMAAERAQDSMRASLEADQLLNQAAALLGIPVAELEKTVNVDGKEA